MVGPVAREDYRFKGEGEVITDGPAFTRALRFFADAGVADVQRRIRAVAVAAIHQLSRPVDARRDQPLGLQPLGQVAPGTQSPGNGRLDGADPGVPLPWSIAVAVADGRVRWACSTP